MMFNLTAESISIVEEFMDVFPEELPGMPPEREVEFYIDLIPRTAPSYRVSRTEAPNRRSSAKGIHSSQLIPLGSTSPVRL
jgi:hypothetical protein